LIFIFEYFIKSFDIWIISLRNKPGRIWYKENRFVESIVGWYGRGGGGDNEFGVEKTLQDGAKKVLLPRFII
jgi:hypothetical protein